MTTRLATPLSSSRVMKQTFPVPGLWRTSTTPATAARALSPNLAREAQAKNPSSAKACRKKLIGCPFNDSRGGLVIGQDVLRQA